MNRTSAAAATGTDPSGGVVHKSGIDPEMGSTKEQPERGSHVDAGDDRTKDTEGRMDREAWVERG